MSTLTVRQMQVLEFVRDRLEQTGKSPGRAEIARALSFRSSKDVEQQLKALAEKRLLELSDTGAIRVLEAPANMELPLVGRLPDGQSAPQWLKNMLHSLTQPQPNPRLRRAAWIQESLFT